MSKSIGLVALFFVLSGCKYTAHEIEKAFELCEQNDGLMWIEWPIVKCNNGAFFDLSNILANQHE